MCWSVIANANVSTFSCACVEFRRRWKRYFVWPGIVHVNFLHRKLCQNHCGKSSFIRVMVSTLATQKRESTLTAVTRTRTNETKKIKEQQKAYARQRRDRLFSFLRYYFSPTEPNRQRIIIHNSHEIESSKNLLVEPSISCTEQNNTHIRNNPKRKQKWKRIFT